MEKLHNNGCDHVDMSVPVMRRSMTKGDFLSMLRHAVEDRFSSNTAAMTPARDAQRRKYLRAIDLFDEFLAENKTVNLDEELLNQFVQHLGNKNQGFRKKYGYEYQICIRCLINGISETLRNRPLLSTLQQKAAMRFSRLTVKSQQAIREFLKNGKKVKVGHQPSIAKDIPLTDSTRSNAVDNLLVVMNVLDLTDVHDLTDDKLKAFIDLYAKEGKQDTATGYLADIATLYRNLVASGIVSDFPSLLNVRKPLRINRDYVPAEGIAKLQDLKTIDPNDFFDVRDRMIVFTLFYDFGLRQGEAVRLNVGDIEIGQNCIDLDLRGEVQKGQKKPDVYLGSYFSESLWLMKRYLSLRQAKELKTDALLVSKIGERLLEPGCINAVKEQCSRLGIKTSKGRAPSCHKFRHAFGTLNIDPMGLRLSQYEIMERLRHEDAQTTRKVYIDSNPLLQKERHMERMKRNGNHMLARNENEQSAFPSMPADDNVLSEKEAVEILSGFGVKEAALRKTAEMDSKAKKKNKKWFFSRSYVEDLKANWICKQEAAEMMGMTDKQLWHWLKGNGIVTKLIGKGSLIRSADILKGVWERQRRKD